MPGVGFVDYGMKPSIGMLTEGFLGLGIDIRSARVPLQRAIKQVMIPSFAQNFQSSGRPGWQVLSEATINTKELVPDSIYPPEMPLLRSGLLFQTIQQQNIWTVTSTEAVVQLPSKIAYGGVHQLGSEESNIPARPFLVFQSEDMDRVQEIFADWVLERALEKLVF